MQYDLGITEKTINYRIKNSLLNHIKGCIITKNIQYTIIIVKSKPNPKIVAIAIIEKNGNILLGKRKIGKFHAGTWEFPGGTVEDGETLEQCLIRE
jgi:NADH pyrophosphatase NudC (nudix superfamily)